jgi:hypothetical protein
VASGGELKRVRADGEANKDDDGVEGSDRHDSKDEADEASAAEHEEEGGGPHVVHVPCVLRLEGGMTCRTRGRNAWPPLLTT